VQVRLSITLPPEYVAFTKKAGGGYFAFTNVYSLTPESDWNIVERNAAVNLIGRGFLAFSENGCGDYYGFGVNSGVCESAVLFFDHDTQQIRPTEYGDLYEYLVDVGLRSGKV
jgi:hypothetical protein